MRRRILAAVAAVVLAVVGGVLVLGYAQAADQRALAGMRTTDVLVVSSLVVEGTTAEELGELVTTKRLPSMAVAPGAITDLEQVRGRVAATDLQPGEQLLTGRFTEAATLDGEVEIPVGMQQVSVLLESQRVLGGHLLAGDTVGVLLTPDDDRSRTRLVLDQVLITRVQGGLPAPEPDSQAAVEAADGEVAETEAGAVPDSGVLVTLALDAEDAERVVLTAERGGIWLTLQEEQTTSADGDVTDLENVLR